MSNEELIEQVLNGDRSALAKLVERHHRPLLGYLFRMVGGNHPLAQDLVQETFIRVLKQRSYAAGRPFKPWLHAIATNLVRDHFRALRNRNSESLEGSTAQSVSDAAPSPEERPLPRKKAGLWPARCKS